MCGTNPSTLARVIDSAFVGREVFFMHHIRPVVSGALVKSHVERRCSNLGPTQRYMPPSILEYTKIMASARGILQCTKKRALAHRFGKTGVCDGTVLDGTWLTNSGGA